MGFSNAVNAVTAGFQSLTSAGVWNGRTLVAGTGISITNPDGTTGNPTISASSGSGISTIDGDTGSITGSTVTIFSNRATLNSGSSVSFTNTGTVSTFNVTDASNNTIIGKGSGSATLTSTSCTSIGQGNFTAATMSGVNQTALGQAVLPVVTSGNFNTGCGSDVFRVLTTGSTNTSIGYNNFFGITSGSRNIGMGSGLGNNYTSSESDNIIIGTSISGTVAESNVIRIGSQGSGSGQQNACYIAGIAGVTSSNPAVVTQNTSTTQMGVDTTNFTILSTGLQLKGNNTNTAPPAGKIGEQMVASSTTTSLTSTTTSNVASISLSAGIWDISALCNIVAGSGGTVATVGISATSATIPGNQGDQYLNQVYSYTQTSLSIPSFRVLLNSTATYYLVVQATFTGSATALGRISAVRAG